MTSATAVALHGDVDLTLPDGLSFDSWEDKLRTYQGIAQGAMWWLGTAIVYGEDRWGDRAAQAITALGFSPHRAQTAAWVARKIPASRRRVSLSWSHHEAVSGLAEAEQEGWLNRAESEGWTRADLRRELGRAKALAEPAHAHRWVCRCGDEMVEGE